MKTSECFLADPYYSAHTNEAYHAYLDLQAVLINKNGPAVDITSRYPILHTRDDGLMIINTGVVAVLRENRDPNITGHPRRIATGLCAAGSVVGVEWLTHGNDPYQQFLMRTLVPTTAHVLDIDSASKLFKGNAKFRELCLGTTSNRISQAESLTDTHTDLTAMGRLILFLRNYAQDPQDSIVYLTHQTIADILGVHREIVVRGIGALKKKGFIRKRHGYGAIHLDPTFFTDAIVEYLETQVTTDDGG